MKSDKTDKERARDARELGLKLGEILTQHVNNSPHAPDGYIEALTALTQNLGAVVCAGYLGDTEELVDKVADALRRAIANGRERGHMPSELKEQEKGDSHGGTETEAARGWRKFTRG